jgi:hypothetical protein
MNAYVKALIFHLEKKTQGMLLKCIEIHEISFLFMNLVPQHQFVLLTIKHLMLKGTAVLVYRQ